MMKVALVALLAAPAAMAFTPDNLRGVWSCKVEDGMLMKTEMTPDLGATYTTRDSSSTNHRVLVFDKPDSTKATRRFEGRSYYMYDGSETHIEEHAFRGAMHNAIEGEFYLDPNMLQDECQRTCDHTGGTINRVGDTNGAADCKEANGSARAGAYAAQNSVAALTPPAMCLCSTNTAHPKGSCSVIAKGPWEFTLDDADHMTLIVDRQDAQAGNNADVSTWNTPLATAHHTLRASLSQPAVFIVEKCMRGLEEGSTFCSSEFLAHSGISTDTDKNNACQGVLQCHMNTASQPWGCTSEACCALPRPTAPQYTPQPYYYQPQLPYYQPMYPQFQSQRFTFGR